MISEEQKYYSGVLRNIGFAFLTPFGSIIFQSIVFKKHVFDSNLIMGIIVSVIGITLIYFGTIPIQEKR